ncbi:Glycoside hydrolase domain containing protein [Aphelenchoides fujianensis]|nr:Glycoside hydrolase domain containing protein [Aphelenchoides fujianensis]
MFTHSTAFFLLATALGVHSAANIPPPFRSDDFDRRFRPLSQSEVNDAKRSALEMFYFGYDNYMKHAWPADELDPIHCKGRGHDHANPDNININDALGDYSLTLLDSLDTLAIVGNRSEFHRAVRLVVDHVSFDRNVTVQVFEASIRVMGGLLSAHLLLTNQNSFLGDFRLPDYNDELLTMAHDLAVRLLPAFDTATGIPYPRVNLKHGVLPSTINETCTAGAGSLLFEFGVLSRLVNDDIFERLARRVNFNLWKRRNKKTGLLGNVIDIQTGQWKGIQSGLGAGLDSFFEYMLKAFILFGDERDLDMYIQADQSIQRHLRRGRPKCRHGFGSPPFHANVDARDGNVLNTWIDSLQASYAGVQVLAGELDEAICVHAFYYVQWLKYGMLAERWNWHLKAPDVHFYPLRPEFVESTYLLYLATKSPFYRHVGREIMNSLNLYCRVQCGWATVHNVLDKSLEDRMESFFLSETTKYLVLLFDDANPVNRHYDRLLFSTEGHVFPILRKFHEPPSDLFAPNLSAEEFDQQLVFGYNESCETPARDDRFGSPLNGFHLGQYLHSVGVSNF